uniref:SAGA-associated factor 11 n=1 Tax=Chaetoceros debilis TaxID=122233 RepID=A0A7S3V420_9STRA|mmetsp:Transcript_18737/g.28463  ORF Transcript_18737/g.28463 Transcript_18737/m.28463 type:complete len:236 (+) Transcript_18737:31-738(+)
MYGKVIKMSDEITKQNSQNNANGDRHNDEPPYTTNNMVEAMYKDLMKTICIDIVSGVHKMAKNGQLPLHQQILRSNISDDGTGADAGAESNGDVKTSIGKSKKLNATGNSDSGGGGSILSSGTGIDTTTAKKSSRKRSWGECSSLFDQGRDYSRSTGSQGNSYGLRQNNLSRQHNAAETPPLSRRTRNADVWGRVPPKEVLTSCKNCGIRISSSRFTSHLDKCLLSRVRSNSRAK